MKTVTETFNIYKYSELSESAKEKVHQWWIESQEPEFFTDMVLEDLCECYNLKNLNVRYSLGYCQGDGLCLVGRININNFIDNCMKNKSSYSNEELSILRYLSNAGLDITLEQYDSFYSHKYTVEFDYSEHISYYLYDYDEETETYCETINGVRYTESDINEVLDAFIDDVKEFIYDLCDTYEKWGYSYFYDITEDVIETLESEYEFYESGKLYA